MVLNEEYPYHIFSMIDDEGHYVATIRELPQCVGHGNTPEEAIANVKKQQLNSIYQLLLEDKEVPHPAEITEQ